MSDQDEIISPFLQKVLDRRGLHDDQVTSLLIVERYQRHPDPNNSIVKQIEQEIMEFQSKPRRQAA